MKTNYFLLGENRAGSCRNDTKTTGTRYSGTKTVPRPDMQNSTFSHIRRPATLVRTYNIIQYVVLSALGQIKLTSGVSSEICLKLNATPVSAYFYYFLKISHDERFTS